MTRLPLIVAPLLTAGMALASSDPEQSAIDGCSAELAGNGAATVLDSMFSEAGTMVFLEDGDGQIWKCIGYKDGAVGSLEIAPPEEAEAALARAAEAAAMVPERIQFAPGTSGASLTRTLDAGGAADFVLGASGGQTMSVVIVPQDGAAYYFVKAPDGSLLIEGTDAGTPYEGKLPQSGDYIIEVVNKESAPLSFDLTVENR